MKISMSRFPILALIFGALSTAQPANAGLCFDPVIDEIFFDSFIVFEGEVTGLSPIEDRVVIVREDGRQIAAGSRTVTYAVIKPYREGLAHYYVIEEGLGIGGKEYLSVGDRQLVVLSDDDGDYSRVGFCNALDRELIDELYSQKIGRVDPADE